jgi:hypothetical protein
MDHLMSPKWRVRGMQFLAAALLAACGGGADTLAPLSNEGSVPQVAPAQSCDFSQALVMVDEMRIRQVGANDIIVTLPEPRPIDLLDPGTGVLEALQTAPLTRDAIDVRLRTSDGTVRLADGTMAPLKVPGILRLTGDFRLATGMVADLVVQGFDRCNAIHAAGNSGQFVLNGDVPAQLLTLPFVTDREQPAGGFLRPIPGDGYATVSNAVTGSFTIRRFDAYGQMQDGAINISLPGDATSVSVTPLANGGVLATWLGPATDPEVQFAQHFPLMVQRFAANGSAQEAPVQVALTQPFTSPGNERDPNPPSLPQAAALADGGAALVWVQVDANGRLNLYLERFAADGSAPSGAQRVNVASEGKLPNVVGLSGGRVLVAWGKGPLFARVFEANGSAGAEQAIAPAAESLFGPPQLAALSNGGAAVAWESAVAGRFSVITRLVLAPDGTPLGPQQLFADGITPSIAGLADGGFVIAWFTQGSAHALRFGPDGSQQGPLFISTSTAAAGPSVVALPWGGFLIGWPTVTDGNPQGVMRFFDAQGLLGS